MGAVRDEGGEAFAQEPVRAGAGGTGYRAGHGADRAAKKRGARSDIEGAGAIASLHDDGSPGEGVEDAVAGEEPPPGAAPGAVSLTSRSVPLTRSSSSWLPDG